ncbi:MAG: TlyA family RNA methyltransferase [Chloroflexia bacterium]|nr:TlyA family RNA methyltransferase [Chloroflexia bacterium]
MSAVKAGRQRLDTLLVERGLTASREKARALILAGQVRVDNQRIDKASAMVAAEALVECEQPDAYASRGGYKLAHALDTFSMDVAGVTALDAGASTGGFTDVLLQRGAARVYAVDVGYGQLDWKLRSDSRVVVMERTNIRYVRDMPEPVQFVTADLSFISLTLVLPGLRQLADEGARYVLLVKPQFEAGRAEVGKHGVVRDPATHRRVLEKIAGHIASLGLSLRGLTASPILGPAGNVEFLAWCADAPPAAEASNVLISAALREAESIRRPGRGRTGN